MNIQKLTFKEMLYKAIRENKWILFIGLKIKDVDNLAIKGGEKASDFHVTLLYGYFTPYSDEDDTEMAIQRVIDDVKAEIPNSIKFDAICRFDASQSSDGKDVIYARVKAGQLENLHNSLKSSLKNYGFTGTFKIEETFSEYNPHMTLAYIDKGNEFPLREIDQVGTVDGIIEEFKPKEADTK